MDLLWSRRFSTSWDGSYIATQMSKPVIDHDQARVYVGTDRGRILGLGWNGKLQFKAHISATDIPTGGTAVAGAVAIGDQGRRLYAVTVSGGVHAFTVPTNRVAGGSQWSVQLGEPISASPVVVGEQLIVVTDADTLTSLDRSNGAVLWTRRRPRQGGFAVAGHSGLEREGGQQNMDYQNNDPPTGSERLFVGYTDGSVGCIEVQTGGSCWERDTSIDVPIDPSDVITVFDVDTTPVWVSSSELYVASHAAGLYVLDPKNGTVLYRDPTLTGISQMERGGPNTLWMASGDLGVVRYNTAQKSVTWSRELPRGVPAGLATDHHNHLYVTESAGNMVMLSATTGEELGRLGGSNHGFSVGPTVTENVGFAWSNGGRLYTFRHP